MNKYTTINNLYLLRYLQASSCLSNNEMAEKLGIPMLRYKRIKRGLYTIRRDKVERLASIFNITIRELLDIDTPYPEFELDIKKVRRLIGDKRMNVAEFCREHNKGKAWIQNLGRFPYDETIGELARALNVKIDEILLDIQE